MIRLLLALIMVLTACPLMAQTPPTTLIIGVEDLDYLPAYGWRNEHFAGAARQILDAFGQAKGYRLVYRPLPVKRLYAELMDGTIDLKFPDSPDWAEQAKLGHKVFYSDPVIAFVDGVMVRPENKGRGVGAIKSLGTVSGYTPLAWRDRVETGSVTLRETSQVEQTLSQVLKLRTDGAYLSIAAAMRILDKELHQPGGLVFDPSLPHGRGDYRLSSVRNQAALDSFDTWLAANSEYVNAIKLQTKAEIGAAP